MSAALFFSIVSVEARKRMGYRADFWINTLFGFVAEFGVAYFVTLALFDQTDRMAGFTRDGLLLYYVSVLLIEKIVRGPEFSGHVSEDIYEGGLTRYLLFPTPYVPFKYAQHVGALVPLVLQAVLFGILAVFLLDVPDDMHVGPASIAACVVAVFVANLLYFLLKLPLQMVAFWQDNVWSLAVALRLTAALLGGGMLPLSFFPGWAQGVIHYLPFRFLLDWPARTLLGQIDPLEWFTSLGWALAWCLVIAWIAKAVWKRGDLKYTGVGI